MDPALDFILAEINLDFMTTRQAFFPRKRSHCLSSAFAGIL
jgi:hypothetical protein